MKYFDGVDLVGHIGKYEELKPEGDRYYCGHASAHTSKEGRCLWVWKEDGVDKWYCQSCNAGVGIVQFEMSRLECGWDGAIESLSMQYPEHAKHNGKDIHRMKASRDTRELMQAVLTEYAGSHTPASLKYLKGRGFTDETIESNLIGFCNAGVKLPDASEDDLLSTGLFHADLTHHHQGRIVFPYLLYGSPVFSISRSITESDTRKYIKHLTYDAESRPYISQDAVQHILWNEEAIADGREIISVEGIIDGILFKQAFPDLHVVSPVGTQWNQEQVDRLKPRVAGLKRITFIPDSEANDKGLEGVLRSAARLDGLETELYVARIRRREGASKVDVADYIQHGLATELRDAWLEFAVPVEYEVQRQANDYNRFKGKAYDPKHAEMELKLMPNYYLEVGSRLHIYQNGYYQDGDRTVRHQIYRLMGTAHRKNKADEVLNQISVSAMVEPDQVNTNPYQVNVKNGVYDIKTGKLSRHTAYRYDTRQCPVMVNTHTDEDVLTITTFLSEVVAPDAGRLALQMVGYCLLGTLNLQKAFMLVGSGNNGKSTFTDLITAMLGEANVSGATLLQLSDDKFVLAGLHGKLANICADIGAGQLKNTEYFKGLAVGDKVNAQHKHGKPFDFRSQATLIFGCNEMPKSFDTTVGFYRRFAMISFPNRFDEGADTDILTKLTTPGCLSALFFLATESIKDVIVSGGFDEPESSKWLLRSYQEDNDHCVSFIRDHVELAIDGVINSSEIKEAYDTWCEEQGIPEKFRKSVQSLGKAIVSEFPEISNRDRNAAGKVWKGIQFV